MEDVKRTAHVMAKHIEANWATLEPIGREQGTTAVGTAMSNVPLVQDVLARATQAEFEQVMARAWAIASLRMIQGSD
jgi:hypothetical protein